MKRWKEQVRTAAQAAWSVDDSPIDHKVQIHITYYHDSAQLDVDNMLKPIQDALCGLVYEDDRQLTDTHGHLRDLNDPYRVRGITAAALWSRWHLILQRHLPGSSGCSGRW